MSKRQNWTIIVVFLLLVFGFTAASLIKKNTEFSEKENRVLAQMPKLNLEDILDGSFGEDYESYLADQFFARNEWIGLKTTVERAAGKQEINDIYFGKDGYLIEKHSGVFQTDTAQANIGYLAGFVEKWSKVYGTDHVKAMIAPNAVLILEDKLPPYAQDSGEEEFIDKIKEALPEGAFTDVRPVLEAHSREDIFYRTDHHWKTLGARYAYETWAQQINLSIVPVQDYYVETLADDFFGTVEAKVNTKVMADSIEGYFPLEKVNYTLLYNHTEEKNDLYDRSFLEGRDKYSVFFGGNQPLIEAVTEAHSDRKLLVLKDSYAHCFLPFAMQDFSTVDIVDLRYFNEDLEEYMEGREYTDILILYNASGFAEDVSIAKMRIS